MKTYKEISKRLFSIALILFLTSNFCFSAEKRTFLYENPEELIVSGYIVGGVILFGVISFMISNIVSKHTKNEDEEKQSHQSFSFRNHHRHYHKKVVKKMN